MANFIRAVVSKKKLRFIPDVSPDSSEANQSKDNEFEVIVINQSDKFASFQLELLTSVTDPNSTLKWYSIEPEVCVKKPPGDRTTFHVAITKAPIPAYDTTIDLTLRVFSVEFANLHTAQNLSLTIEKPRKSLRIYLPIKDLKVYPGDAIEIPVLVYNLSPRFTEVTLSCLELEPSWLNQGRKQRLQIDPGESEKITFWCQPPKSAKTLSQIYNFAIEAHSETSRYSTREEGTLEVLPQGFVEFSCTPKKQRIPRLRSALFGKHADSATYELRFENNSNLPQQVSVDVLGQDRKRCDLVLPEPVNLNPGETKQVHLVAKKARSWGGRKQRLLLEVAPVLSDPDTGESSTQIFPDPSIQILELDVFPVIPLWLQVLGAFLLLLLLWLLWWRNPVGHDGRVHSVRFSGDATTVISGSSDGTIRRWLVNTSSGWQFDPRRLKPYGRIAADINKAVSVVRHIPENNDIVAAGLENGEIQLWDVKSQERFPKTFIHPKGDRVFGLEFSKNSRHLFSVHSSGSIRQWNMESDGNQLSPEKILNVPFSISALGLSESSNRNSLVVIGGRYNQLALWDWANNNKPDYVSYRWEDRKNSNNFPSVMGQHHYIESLATAGNLLASADNQGYITLWDMNDRTCSADSNNNVETATTNNSGNRPESVECEISILAQWREGHGGKPVRSLALTEDGCYLASTGDDGRVILWSVTRVKQNFDEGAKPEPEKILARFPGVRLNSVDITRLGKDIYVTSDGRNYQVEVYRVKGTDTNANCQ